MAHYTASGKVKLSILLQGGKNYFLGLVLKSESGDWYIMNGSASKTQFNHGKEQVLPRQLEIRWFLVSRDRFLYENLDNPENTF